MEEIGKKDVVVGSRILNLERLNNIYQRPDRMPYIPNGKSVICGFDQGLGELMLLCETLEDMQYAYDSYARGMALSIYWYTGEVVRVVVHIVEIPGDYLNTAQLVDTIYPEISDEVRNEIVAYARGNYGIGDALATLAADSKWTSAEQVREWVGWPLSEYSPEHASEIWDRFNKQN